MLRLCSPSPSPPSANRASASSSSVGVSPFRPLLLSTSGFIGRNPQRNCLYSNRYGDCFSLPSTRLHSQSFKEVQGRREGFDIKARLCCDSFMPSSPNISKGREHPSTLTNSSKDCQGTSTVLGERICYQLPSAFNNKFSNELQLESLKHSSLWDQATEQSVIVPVQATSAASSTRYFDLKKQLGLTPAFAKLHKLAKASGCLSLGISRSRSMTKIDGDNRKLLLPSKTNIHSQEEQGHIGARVSGNASSSIARVTIRVSPKAIDSDANDTPAKITAITKSSTIKRRRSKRAEIKSTARATKTWKTVPPRRDLFRTPVQLYGIVLCFPFMDAKSAATSLLTLSIESLEELVGIFNQIAIGLAGSGFTLVMFVALRLLTFKTTLDSSNITVFVRGMGLIWLSSAVKSLRRSVKCLTRSDYKLERKELMAKLKCDLQSLTFKAFTLIILLVVRFG